MDGNGRWATARGLPRIAGHREGARAVRRTIEAAIEQGVGWLTLYAFSSENWRRPAGEVLDLTGLLRQYLKSEVAELRSNGVRLRVIGEPDRFGADMTADLSEAVRSTAMNTRLNLTVALSYGARAEIASAARALAAGRAGWKPRPLGHRRGGVCPLPVHRRHAGPRSGDPDVGRAASVQFPAVADGVRRVRLSGRALAGLRVRRISPQRWRNMRGGSGVLAQDRPEPTALRWSDLQTRAVSAVILAPLAIGAIWAGGAIWAAVILALAAGIACEWVLSAAGWS